MTHPTPDAGSRDLRGGSHLPPHPPLDNLLAAVLTVSLADAGDSAVLAVLETTEDTAERVDLFTRRGIRPTTAAAYAGLDASLLRQAFVDPDLALDGIAARAGGSGSSGSPGEAA